MTFLDILTTLILRLASSANTDSRLNSVVFPGSSGTTHSCNLFVVSVVSAIHGDAVIISARQEYMKRNIYIHFHCIIPCGWVHHACRRNKLGIGINFLAMNTGMVQNKKERSDL